MLKILCVSICSCWSARVWWGQYEEMGCSCAISAKHPHPPPHLNTSDSHVLMCRGWREGCQVWFLTAGWLPPEPSMQTSVRVQHQLQFLFLFLILQYELKIIKYKCWPLVLLTPTHSRCTHLFQEHQPTTISMITLFQLLSIIILGFGFSGI